MVVKYLTLNALISSELIKSSAPIKVAEFGCTNGEISYNLAEIIGRVNPKSLLCLISDTIGNDSSNSCLDAITQAEQLPNL